MPARKQPRKQPKVRSLDEIEQVWRFGPGMQRMCGCDEDDTGPCPQRICIDGSFDRTEPGDGKHADCDFGTPLTKAEIEQLRQAKRTAYLQAEFADSVDEDTARCAHIDWLEFEREQTEFRAWRGRNNAEQVRKNEKEALTAKVLAKVVQLLKKLPAKQRSVRHLTMVLCDPKNHRQDELNVRNLKFPWTYKRKKKSVPFWTLYDYVKRARKSLRS